MAVPVCPSCSCTIGDAAYEKEGVVYCCEPCAEQRECECGCCRPVEVEKKTARGQV